MLFEKIENVIRSIDFKRVSSERKKVLQPLIDFIQVKNNRQEQLRLNFICTHNSRRSHLAQIWAQTAAYFYGINNTYCYSGGTEATALFPMVVDTLKEVGFKIESLAGTNNPIYAIKFSDNEHAIIGFSKTYDDLFNPQSRFAAIMTCSQADAGCPFVAGTEKRIAITYEDPKEFDATPQQAEKYQERNIQIATEMLYVFSQIKSKK